MKPFRYALLCLLPVLLPMSAGAQVAKAINEHPATQVTFEYLRNAMGKDWVKAAALIEADSLETLKQRYIRRIKASATIDEEMAHVRRLDCNRLKDVESLSGKEFYIRYHKGIQLRFEVDQAKLDKILASLAVKLLSLAEEKVEDQELCHILVRTRHSDGEKQVSALDLVSLVKVEDAWKVTLNAKDPYVKPVDGKK